MNTRYKITRLNAEGMPTISLEECQRFFASQPDFVYCDSFSVTQDGVNMKITGHFFMWQIENGQIPYRFFDGEIYVAVSHPQILERTKDIARQLEALYVEG